MHFMIRCNDFLSTRVRGGREDSENKLEAREQSLLGKLHYYAPVFDVNVFLIIIIISFLLPSHFVLS